MRYYLIYDSARVIAIHKTRDSGYVCYINILRNCEFIVRLILKEVDSDIFGIIRSETILQCDSNCSTTLLEMENDEETKEVEIEKEKIKEKIKASESTIDRQKSFHEGKAYLT